MSRFLKAPTIPSSDWISQPEAARIMNVSLIGVGWLIARDRISPAYDPSGEKGVTRDSVSLELKWRSSAKLTRKVYRAIGGILKFL